MESKEFFRQRTKARILAMAPRKVYTQRNLVQLISDTPEDTSIILRTQLTPGKFYIGKLSDASHPSRKQLRDRKSYLKLVQPKNLTEAATGGIPLDYRRQTFENWKQSKVRQEEINLVGVYWFPLIGNDRRARFFPIYSSPEGTRILAYSEKLKQEVREELKKRKLPKSEIEKIINEVGIKVMPYADALRVSREGGKVAFEVPSRQKKKSHYKGKLVYFPLEPSTDEKHNPKAIIWGSKVEWHKSPENELWEIRYTSETSGEGSDMLRTFPQEFAGYMATAGKYWREEGNEIPMMMNPYPLASQDFLRYHLFLKNNVLIYDPMMQNKDHLRQLRLNEICMLEMRKIFVDGHDKTIFWDWESKRDSNFRNYNCSIPGENK